MRYVTIFLFLLITLKALGQTDTTRVLKEVTIESDRTNVSLYTSMRYIQIITAEEIRKLAGLSVSDILEYANNVDIRERSISGVQADVQVRTGNFEQTLIMLNGIPLNDPQTGHHTGHIPIDPQIIERIEILTGAGSRIFGMNAYSGVINIVTKKESQEKINLRGMVGDFKTYHASITYHAPKTWKGLLLNANYRQSHGFRPNTDYKIYQVFAQFTHKLKNTGELTAFITNGNKSFGAYNFYTPKFPHQFESNWLTMAGVSLSRKFSHASLMSQAYIRRHQDRFELFRHDLPEDIIPSWYMSHNYHLTYAGGIQNSFVYASSMGKLFAGFDLRYETIFSNKLGTMFLDSIPTPFDDGFYTRRGERWYMSLPVDFTIQIQKTRISPGTMVVYYQNENKFFFLPGLDFSFQAGDKHILFASVNTNTRMPSFTEMYYADAAHSGNPDLLPETGAQMEAGWQYIASRLRIHLNAYYRQSSNTIDWVRSSVQEKWQSQNISDIQTYGLETDLIWYMNFNILKKIRLFYAYNELLRFKSQLFSKYALDFLKHKASISTDLSYRKWNALMRLMYLHRRGTYQDYPSGEIKHFKPQYLVNANISWQLRKNINLFLSIYNLLNQQTFDFGLIPLPPRWAMTGINISLQ